jgi:hypothetical protein
VASVAVYCQLKDEVTEVSETTVTEVTEATVTEVTEATGSHRETEKRRKR